MPDIPKTHAQNEARRQALLKKLDQINAIVKRDQAKRKAKERRDDTRRKILAGAMLMNKVATGKTAKSEFRHDMDSYLEHDRDRILFDLDVENRDPNTQQPAAPTPHTPGAPQ